MLGICCNILLLCLHKAHTLTIMIGSLKVHPLTNWMYIPHINNVTVISSGIYSALCDIIACVVLCVHVVCGVHGVCGLVCTWCV